MFKNIEININNRYIQIYKQIYTDIHVQDFMNWKTLGGQVFLKTVNDLYESIITNSIIQENEEIYCVHFQTI